MTMTNIIIVVVVIIQVQSLIMCRSAAQGLLINCN